MRRKLIQAKHVPTLPILAFLKRREDAWPGPGSFLPATGFWWPVGDPYYYDSVKSAMPPETPYKVGLAKMRRLVDQGLVSGCPCGCRGDYTVTDSGAEYLAKSQEGG